MEPKWIFHGRDRREAFDKRMTPQWLKAELEEYQQVLGIDFGLAELLKIKDIEAKAFIAESLCDMPEFFMDMLGVSRQYSQFQSISGELSQLTEVLQQYLENK